jgi:general secretion pathway protein D
MNGPLCAQQVRVPEAAGIERKLTTLIIPKAEFKDATVRETVDFIYAKTKQLDTKEPDPAKRGVPFALKAISINPIPGPNAPLTGLASPFKSRVTLSVANIPLGELIRYVAAVADLDVVVEKDVVVLSPTPPAELITTEYKLPPALIDHVRGSNGAKAFLQRWAHVSFPEGSSVVFNDGTQRLTLKNTQKNHERVEARMRGAF